jgi:glycosyltransferase involved in cell wall biosynthesis
MLLDFSIGRAGDRPVRAGEERRGMMALSASVVIATHRRPELLKRCLSALLLQSFDPSAYEIVVVDDGGDAQTRAMVAGWARTSDLFQWVGQPEGDRRYPAGGEAGEVDTARAQRVEIRAFPAVRYLATLDRRGPAAARNIGWRAASGAVIAFTDDDTIPAPGWLQAGVDAIQAGYAGVMGQTIVPLPPAPSDHELNTAGLERSEFITANCFYLRSALEAVGGFDERFTVAWREDSDLFFTLLERGYPLAHASGALVTHPVRPARWGASLAAQKKSQFNALLYKKHPDLYRQRIRPLRPPLYYPLVGLLGAAIALAVIGAGTAALVCLAGWLVLTGLLTWRRLERTSKAPRHVAEMVVTSLVIPILSIFWRLYGAVKFRVLFW